MKYLSVKAAPLFEENNSRIKLLIYWRGMGVPMGDVSFEAHPLCCVWQFERDVMIWNNKKYISKPMLVKEDSAIQKHRRWFSQFYSENSPRLRYQHDTMDF